MHLTNSQLLEPNDVEMNHISGCNICKVKFNNRLSIKNRLKKELNKGKLELPLANWNEFNHKFKEHKIAKENVFHIKINGQEKKRKWRQAVVGLAASLFIALGIQMNTGTSDTEVLDSKQIIASLIEENKKLLLQLKKLKKNSHSVNESKIFLEMELAQIDLELQKLYINSDNDKSKIKLWTKRQDVINELMALNNQVDVIRI